MVFVAKAWSTSVIGSPSYVWEHKLKATKLALKEWVKYLSNSLTALRKVVVQQLADLQLELESSDITIQALEKEKETQYVSFQSFKHEEEYWRLKSRSLWLNYGDHNTTFFKPHQYRARLSQNHISYITSADGTVSKGFVQVIGRCLYSLSASLHKGWAWKRGVHF